MSRALILDFDASVKPLPGADVVAVADRQEAVRFGCRKHVLVALEPLIGPALDTGPRVVFMGSGDFHHVSYLLIERLRRRGAPVQIVVFDNHPDNMRYPFGIHCGSWVWHVSRLPFVARVVVVGITSTDVAAGRLWENHLVPLYSGKVVYFCVERGVDALRRIGVRRARSYPSTAAMLRGLASALAAWPESIYLSIDKDVLAPEVVQTNWDQGVMQLQEMTSAIRSLRDRVVGADVVGDVSLYRYRSWFKRLLSGVEGQPEIPPRLLDEWQERHRAVNLELLSLLVT
jgi:arginase family enzyme